MAKATAAKRVSESTAKAGGLKRRGRATAARTMAKQKQGGEDAGAYYAKGFRAARAKPVMLHDYADIAVMQPASRIDFIRRGVPSKELNVLAQDMGLARNVVVSWIGIPQATLNRKLRNDQALTAAESERAVGVAMLVGAVERMVDPDAIKSGFEPAKWVGAWLSEPNPALGNVPPGQYLDTADGRKLAMDLLVQTQTGTFA